MAKDNMFVKCKAAFDTWNKNGGKKKVSWAITGLLAIVIIWLAVAYAVSGGWNSTKAPQNVNHNSVADKFFDPEGIELNAKVTISTEVIEDGLRDMGVLITQEYFFTQVETYEKEIPAGPITAVTSTARMVYSYDGTVSAGIDCEKIFVNKDDENLIITITIPEAEIQYVDIDLESFKIYEEKQGLWSKIRLADVNKSLVEFKESVKERAIEKDIIQNADKNAEQVIERFIYSLDLTGNYIVRFEHK